MVVVVRAMVEVDMVMTLETRKWTETIGTIGTIAETETETETERA